MYNNGKVENLNIFKNKELGQAFLSRTEIIINILQAGKEDQEDGYRQIKEANDQFQQLKGEAELTDMQVDEFDVLPLGANN